ncbi:MAG: hypothetical protein JSV99_03385 [Planctomycetota bacterium]|nr:MAG: hypothetical protein JSV99_03385 [Planctomycetota bacterium]
MVTPKTKRVLITIKAPPNPSRKYQETNCCAGIDLESGEWIRLYPIPFRLLDYNRQFPKYSIISVKCQRPARDKRIESYKVDQDTIKILGRLDTRNNWSERKKIVLKTLSPSFCKILQDVPARKSLGIFKPTDIRFEISKTTPKDEKKRRAAYNQYHLFDRKLDPIEQIPFSFYYKFKCLDSPDCPDHKLMIHDWELMQSHRTWRRRYKDTTVLLSKITQKWFDELCGPKKDTYFYVGNMWQHPKQFIVLGVFYPPKSHPTLFPQ